MLNITRRVGERIVVGEDIFVSVLEVSGQSVRLGIDAPRAVRVYREELWLEIKAENEAAVRAAAGTGLPDGELPELGERREPTNPAPSEAESSPHAGSPEAGPPSPSTPEESSPPPSEGGSDASR